METPDSDRDVCLPVVWWKKTQFVEVTTGMSASSTGIPMKMGTPPYADEEIDQPIAQLILDLEAADCSIMPW